MKTLSQLALRFLAVSCFLLFTTSYGFAQWAEENPFNEDQCIEMDFPTENDGFSIVAKEGGGYAFFITDDAGKSWVQSDVEFIDGETVALLSLSFASKDVGYILLRINGQGVKSYILKTENGGESWEDVSPENVPTGYGEGSVFFVNEKVGHCSVANILLSTNDGGETWKRKVTETWSSTRKIDFYDEDHGIFGTWDGTFAYKGTIYTTSNGGTTWDSLQLMDYQTAISQVDYASAETAFVLSNEGQRIYRTNDAGKTWDTLRPQVLIDSSDQAMDMEFLNAKTGFFITTQGYIYKTIDGGDSWTLAHGRTLNMRDITYNGSVFLVSGPKGALLRSEVYVGVQSPKEQGLPLYPNPCSTTGVLHINGIVAGAYQLTDLTGRVVAHIQLAETNAIGLASYQLKPGHYILKSPETASAPRRIILQ